MACLLLFIMVVIEGLGCQVEPDVLTSNSSHLIGNLLSKIPMEFIVPTIYQGRSVLLIYRATLQIITVTPQLSATLRFRQ